MKRISLLTVVVALSCGQGVLASDRELHIVVSPLQPTDSMPIAIDVWTWFPDSGQEFVSASHVREGHEIDIDVILQDLHGKPGVGFYLWATHGGGSVSCGILPAGAYAVSADIWLIPWGSDVPELHSSGTGSFTVIPEPTLPVTLVGAGVGLIALLRRQRAWDAKSMRLPLRKCVGDNVSSLPQRVS